MLALLEEHYAVYSGDKHSAEHKCDAICCLLVPKDDAMAYTQTQTVVVQSPDRKRGYPTVRRGMTSLCSVHSFNHPDGGEQARAQAAADVCKRVIEYICLEHKEVNKIIILADTDAPVYSVTDLLRDHYDKWDIDMTTSAGITMFCEVDGHELGEKVDCVLVMNLKW